MSDKVKSSLIGVWLEGAGSAGNAGSMIDFVVDPGPALDINFDATAVNATINLR